MTSLCTVRITHVSSTLICYCSQLQSTVASFNVSFSRVVPHPSAHCCLNWSRLFCTTGLPAATSFQLPVFNLISGSKVDSNIQELMSKLAWVLEYFLVIVCKPKADITLVILDRLYWNCGRPKTSRLWPRWFLMLNFKNFVLNVLAGPYKKFLGMAGKKNGNFTRPSQYDLVTLKVHNALLD